MTMTLTRRALAATGVTAFLLAGAACGNDDDGAADDPSTTTSTEAGQPGHDSNDLGALCLSTHAYLDHGDATVLPALGEAADAIGDLTTVQDAATFLADHPNPATEEDQRQAEDARSLLQSDVLDAGLCDTIGDDGEAITEGDLTVAMCGEWDSYKTTGDITSLSVILRNVETIGLSVDAADAVLLLTDPQADPDLHETALASADDGFAALC